ncbi:unnamed protein product [Peronospora destructor]|uniref:Uncharacterized protein n=1 Tax=Peronospora destructor TaxID=86335 RepID=A0AAV0T070_9STRA|nr:unnamed protein product [Peronospora destructor]
MVSSFIKCATMAVAMLTLTAEAHNTMTDPMPTWSNTVSSKNNPSGHIDPEVLPCPKGMTYTTELGVYLNVFWTAFNASSYKSLKEFVLEVQTLEPGATKECGFSTMDGTPRDLPDMIQWDFFTPGHKGPFVAHCDDVLVAQSYNAADEYPGNPANIPYDKASCAGASMLTSYWLALHAIPWQVYTNCAPLTGAKPATTPTTAPPPTETPAVAAPTVKPESSNPASSSSNSPPTDDASTETPAVAAPTAKKEPQTDVSTDGEQERSSRSRRSLSRLTSPTQITRLRLLSNLQQPTSAGCVAVMLC